MKKANGVKYKLMSEKKFMALEYRDFRLFWMGQTISVTGTWMHSTAQGWLVYSLTRSPYWLGVVAACSSLPVLLLSLFGGVAADRLPKRNLLLVTQALSIVPAVAVGILTSLGVVQVWQVICLALLFGTLNAFDIPARQSFMAEMVTKNHLMNAIALNSASFNAARMVGPMIAGLAISYMGVAACFYLNALSFVPVVIALWMIKTSGEPHVSGRSVLGEIADGLRFMRGEPAIWKTVLVISAFSLFGMPFSAMLPVMAEEVLGVGAKGFGFMASALGAGAFLAAVTLALAGQMKDTRRTMSIAALVFPVALFAFASSTRYALSLCALVVAGFAVVSFMALANTTIQVNTPDNMRGRMMSVFALTFLGMAPLGNYVMGTAADSIGTVQALHIASAVCFVSSGIIMWGIRSGGRVSG